MSEDSVSSGLDALRKAVDVLERETGAIAASTNVLDSALCRSRFQEIGDGLGRLSSIYDWIGGPIEWIANPLREIGQSMREVAPSDLPDDSQVTLHMVGNALANSYVEIAGCVDESVLALFPAIFKKVERIRELLMGNIPLGNVPMRRTAVFTILSTVGEALKKGDCRHLVGCPKELDKVAGTIEPELK